LDHVGLFKDILYNSVSIIDDCLISVMYDHY